MKKYNKNENENQNKSQNQKILRRLAWEYTTNKKFDLIAAYGTSGDVVLFHPSYTETVARG